MGEEEVEEKPRILKTISLILLCGGIVLFFLALFIWIGFIDLGIERQQSLFVSLLSFILSAIFAIVGDRLGEM
ncbi:MAG: hypothetical protein ACTSXJ_06545 [Candidatus Baldrarchaeia archaeon]